MAAGRKNTIAISDKSFTPVERRGIVARKTKMVPDGDLLVFICYDDTVL